ncbi:MAG TPA: hypothetical protein VF607_01560, partial [Verrucomicrobiae bacterium]
MHITAVMPSVRCLGRLTWCLCWLWLAGSARAVVLWSNYDPIPVNNNRNGVDLLGGAVKRDDGANDTLYFKFHVDPLSDEATEPY